MAQRATDTYTPQPRPILAYVAVANSMPPAWAPCYSHQTLLKLPDDQILWADNPAEAEAQLKALYPDTAPDYGRVWWEVGPSYWTASGLCEDPTGRLVVYPWPVIHKASGEQVDELLNLYKTVYTRRCPKNSPCSGEATEYPNIHKYWLHTPEELERQRLERQRQQQRAELLDKRRQERSLVTAEHLNAAMRKLVDRYPLPPRLMAAWEPTWGFERIPAPLDFLFTIELIRSFHRSVLSAPEVRELVRRWHKRPEANRKKFEGKYPAFVAWFEARRKSPRP